MVYYCCNYKLCISSSLSLSLSSIFFVSVCVCGFWFGRERERERKEKKEVRREEKNAIKFRPSLVHLGFIAKWKWRPWADTATWLHNIGQSLLLLFLTFTMKNCNTRPIRLRGKKYNGFIWLQINFGHVWYVITNNSF